MMEENFFSKKNTPKRKIEENQESSTQPNTNALSNKFGKDLLSLLGQGNIKKDPIRKNKPKKEKTSPEMEAQIKEIFGDDEKIIF